MNDVSIRRRACAAALLIGLSCGHLFSARPSDPSDGGVLGPAAMAVAPDGRTLYVACRDGRKLLAVDAHAGAVTRSVRLPPAPGGIAIAPGGTRLFVTCAAPESTIVVLAAPSLETVRSFPAGHTATAPCLSPDGKRLYVCNRFDNEVAVIDASAGEKIAGVAVTREPVAAALTPDGRHLVVANHLPLEPADGFLVRGEVTIIDTETLKATRVRLPDGSMALRDVAILPGGTHAMVTHVIGTYTLVTTQVSQGWINTGAVSVVDIAKKEFDSNALLDSFFKGAPNPWGIGISADGGTICVAHSGSREVSVVDTARMLEEIRMYGEFLGPMGGENVIEEFRRRVVLPGVGPRAVRVIGSRAYVAEYFSDTIAVVSLPDEPPGIEPTTIRLGPEPTPSLRRRGEMLFHDATLCLEQWQSCASCHPDGRADALNWDLLNDGGGSPRNTKSLVFSHRTPPAMALGVRSTARVAVKAGLDHILFAYEDDYDEGTVDAIYAYIKSLRPVPSPRLVGGTLSAAARRGKKLFMSDALGCSRCHPPPLYTDCRKHEVFPAGDYFTEEYDTPTLRELWRTAPYMNTGKFTTLEKLFVEGKHGASRGNVDKLTRKQVADLVAFLLSL